MTWPVVLGAGAAFLGVGVVTLVVLALGRSRVVPLSRRRPGVTERSATSHVAEALSHATGRLLGSRAGDLDEALQLAGVHLRGQDFVVMVGSAVVVLLSLGLLVGGPIVGVLGMLLTPILAYVSLRIMTGRRRAKFAHQMDETLSILSGSLRAGYSLPQASATVANEADAPTSEEFTRIMNEARVGRPLTEAMEDSAQRVKNDDFFWVIQAIAINREVGGNLAEVLEAVSHTIRERSQLKRQVEALAAEGKLSAIVLGALPFVVLLVLSFLNPGYVATFGTSLLGILLLAVAAVLLIIGLLWLRAAVRIKF